ncbi:DNA-3-methyladenine glycosylase [Nesterenkonia muleiensis]|uniref:DNA-3-methyladenine glycosylase n=1 Tax=Nesterenkonia muleiensis TaxID=2282648 RepID=UPI000E71E660|nr:DNA-3-methyladenine glycosylase [Nesterenkonia muleiensis]
MDAQQLRALFDSHAVELAPHLLGCELTVTTDRGSVTVRLTEVEAYGGQGEDPGAHSYRGRTARNASLFGPPRHAYVYQSYGIHYCLNLTAHTAAAGGVLLRAAEVLTGRDLAVDRRGGKDTGAKLLSGPGRLGQGLGVTLPMDGSAVQVEQTALIEQTAQEEKTVQREPHDDAGAPPGPNTEVSFRLTPAQAPIPAVGSGPRVGVSGAGGTEAFPWRFWIEGHPTVSQYRPGRQGLKRSGVRPRPPDEPSALR